MEEIWKNISGYDGLYQVSSLGRVKNSKGRILKPSKNNYGYLVINLCKYGKVKLFQIHRLVAEAFISNPNNYPIINHKDENPLNNCVDNLEWCTYRYNNTYGNRIQKMVANTDYKAIALLKNYKEIGRKVALKISKKVYQFTKDGEFIREWNSVRDTVKGNFNEKAVAACCRGERKSHKGYIWRYKE